MTETKKKRTSVWRSILPFLIITLIGFLFAYQFVDPAPPGKLIFATGSPNGAYYRYATQYQAILAADGIDVEVIPTAGTIENLGRLRGGEDRVDAAFIQGGTVRPRPEDTLLSLGSMILEPVWVFYRGLAKGGLGGFEGKRVAIGPEGSGTHALMRKLFPLSGIGGEPTRLLPIGGETAAEHLLAGKIDAMVMVSAADAPLVRRMANQADIKMMDWYYAEAYARTQRGIAHVDIPAGAFNLRDVVPKSSCDLIAAAANLVVREDLHPALSGALLRAALEVHAGASLFAKEGQFPTPEHLEFPLSPEARRIYKHGPPFLQRYLPFWAATFIDRMKVMLLPMLALLIPLLRVFPPVYRWRMRSRIYRWYRRVRAVNVGVYEQPDAPREPALRELERIERDLAKVNVPLSYSDELYHLQAHIELVRRRITTAPTDRESGSE